MIQKKINVRDSKYNIILIYSTIYISIILLFAVLFTVSGDFYHATVQYEQTYKMNNKNLITKLRDEIIAYLQSVHQSITVTYNNWSINLSELHLLSLSVSEEYIEFQIEMIAVKSGQNIEEYRITSFLAQFPNSEDILIVGLTNQDNIHYKMISFVTDSHFPFPLEIFFPSNEQLGTVLPISEELHVSLQSYYKDSQGLPYNKKNNFWRMLYLSVVTITTLGYGDIVPLSGLTRGLIALEAISGTLIVGFFLNSIANLKNCKRRKRQTLFTFHP